MFMILVLPTIIDPAGGGRNQGCGSGRVRIRSKKNNTKSLYSYFSFNIIISTFFISRGKKLWLNFSRVDPGPFPLHDDRTRIRVNSIRIRNHRAMAGFLSSFEFLPRMIQCRGSGSVGIQWVHFPHA